jgi:putative aldouronate transport system substrate-binding protein
MKSPKRDTAFRSTGALISILLILALAGCVTPTSIAPTATGAPEASASAQADTTTPPPALTFDEEMTIDFYYAPVNISGLISGWGGKILKDRFNLKINLIAPNISGQAIYQTRSAAGNLGDLVLLGAAQLKDSVDAGLFLDMTETLNQYGPNLMAFSANAIKATQEMLGTDKIYAVPDCVSTLSPLDPVPSVDGVNVTTQSGGAVYLRWDLYQKIGAPKLNTMEDLLPVLKQMQEICPTSISGKKTYPISMFKDWDWYAMKAVWESFPTMYGYQFNAGASTILINGDPRDFKVQRLDDDSGIYYRSLKFYFQANQMGLVDPDSPTLTWDTSRAKVKDGQTLFYWWSWGSISQFNTPENSNADPPVGFAFIPISDAKYYDDGFKPLGQWGEYIGIGSKAKDPKRLVALLDWLATPEGAQTLVAGPKGLTWEEKDGQPVFTEFGLKAKTDITITVPDEWGGGEYGDRSLRLPQMIYWFNMNPDYGVPYNPNLWPSYMETASTKLDKQWQEAYGADHMIDYIVKNNMVSVAAGSSYVAPTDSEDIKNARSQCGNVVLNTSWQMVFAKDQAEFDSLWADMKTQLQGLGWENIYEVDMQNAKDYNAAGMKAINDFMN